MLEFFEAVLQPQNAFLRNALMVGVLASIACGVVGTYVVTRRISYIAGGIAHCVLGGMGAAKYCQVVYGIEWLHPMFGAIVAALLAAIIIGLVSLRAKQREDTVIGAVWAVGMAAGILFISKTPGYNEDLMNYLFGNILMVSSKDIWLIGFLDLVVVAIVVAGYNQFLAVCFDAEFARLRGIPVEAYYLLLLSLIALAVVLLVSVVGIILVIALLTLPAAIAGHCCKRLWKMMLLAGALCLLFTTSGLAFSYGPSLPSGALTIILAGIVYICVVFVRSLAARKRG